MWNISWLWPTTIEANFERDLLLFRCSSTHSITYPSRSQYASYSFLPSCELHSRSLAVGRTGASDLTRVMQSRAISGFRECATQSRDCTNSQIARNIYVFMHFRMMVWLQDNCMVNSWLPYITIYWHSGALRTFAILLQNVNRLYDKWSNCFVLLHVAPSLLCTVTSLPVMPKNLFAVPSPSLGIYQCNKCDTQNLCKK